MPGYLGNFPNTYFNKKCNCCRVMYSLDQCEFVATSLSCLKRHIKSKYEGVRYPCSQFEFAASRASYLKKHVESKYIGVRYS